MTTSEIIQQQSENAEAHKLLRAAESKIKELSPTRERALALTNLQQAKHWLQEDQYRLTHELAKAIPTNNA